MKLDVQRLGMLLEKADDAWFRKQSGAYKYREHLAFTADFIAKHYDDKRIKPNSEEKEGHEGRVGETGPTRRREKQRGAQPPLNLERAGHNAQRGSRKRRTNGKKLD